MKTQDTDNLSKFQLRRQKLMEITADARKLREQLANDAKSADEELAIMATPLNDLIVRHYYKIESEKPLKTFKQWKEDGKNVKKGSKAFVLWGRPLEAQAEEGEEVEGELGKYFPLVYLFTSAQVE